MSTPGYLYVLSNPSIPGQLKIGMTTRDVSTRMKELSSATGVPTPFKLHFQQFFDDCALAERRVHALLAAKRVNCRREFFRVGPGIAVRYIRRLANEMNRPAGVNITGKALCTVLALDMGASLVAVLTGGAASFLACLAAFALTGCLLHAGMGWVWRLVLHRTY